MKPLISVVVPCRNEAASLCVCLDALALQDFPRERFEVIVVDGGSTDGCREMAAERGARVLSDGADGPAGARNVGIHAARGEVVAFTDADCVPRTDWLTRVAEVFAEDPSLAGVAGALRMPRETFLGRLEDDEARAFYRGFITSNVAYRRDALLAVGGFDASLKCAEDYDLAWRLMDAGYRIVHDPRPVVVHAPPEASGTVVGYLRKQYWYARSDVPAQARALRRWRTSRSAAGSSRAVLGAADALTSAGVAGALGLGAVARSPRLAAAALGLTLAGVASRVARVARLTSETRELPARVALLTARRLARGAGTLAGCAQLLAPWKRRALLSAPAPVGLRAAPGAAWRAAPSARALP